jgi:hypothetical protein
MVDFDNLQVGDTVLYQHRTVVGGCPMSTPCWGIVREVSGPKKKGEARKTFRVEFYRPRVHITGSWFFGFELRKCEGTAEECDRAYATAPMPRWT